MEEVSVCVFQFLFIMSYFNLGAGGGIAGTFPVPRTRILAAVDNAADTWGNNSVFWTVTRATDFLKPATETGFCKCVINVLDFPVVSRFQSFGGGENAIARNLNS